MAYDALAEPTFAYALVGKQNGMLASDADGRAHLYKSEVAAMGRATDATVVALVAIVPVNPDDESEGDGDDLDEFLDGAS